MSLNRCILSRLALCAAVVLPLHCRPAGAEPLDLTGRQIPLQLASDHDAARAFGAGNASAQELTATVTLTPEQAQLSYGLLVPAGGIETNLELNGRRLDLDAVVRSDSALFHLPAGALRTGENTLVIRRSDAVSDSWAGTTLFSLDGTVEEAHFALVFRDRKLDPRVGPPPHSEQSKYDVLSYDCSWRPSTFSSSLLAASVTMRAKSLDSSLQTVVLDFDSNGGSLSVSSVDQGPDTSALPYSLNTSNNWLIIQLPSPVPAGSEFQVRVNYSGTPRQNYSGGLATTYRRTTHGPSSHPVIYTASQPYGARRWWPCKDLPDDKATTTIQRITVPEGYEVVSNGRLASRITNPDSSVTWVWENSYPIATYLVSFATSNYVYSTATYTALDGETTMAISHAIYPENIPYEGNGAQGTLQVLNLFASLFGEYPFLREKYATVSWNINFGIEHQTCTGMPGANQGSFTDGSVGNGLTRRNIHELAHHWYGDSVTYHTFDHAWLGEGFATYAEALWDEYALGKSAYHSYVNSWSINTSTPIVGPNSDSYTGGVIYRRGAWVLHMLRRVLGDEDFFETMKEFIRPAPDGHGYSTATSEDFESVAERVSGKDLTAFFRQWLYRPNGDGPVLPVYRYNATAAPAPDNSGYNVTFQISQVQGGSVPFTMPLEFQVTDESGHSHIVTVENNSFSQTLTVPTGTTRPLQITFDPENWVLNSEGLSIRTCGLPDATVGVSYTRSLVATSGDTPYSWSASGSLPPGVSLLSNGQLIGLPTTEGDYEFQVTVTDSKGVQRTTTLHLHVGASAPPAGAPPLIINEVFYDPNGSSDAGEFIELYNTSSEEIEIGGCQVLLVNGSNGQVYGPTIQIPGGTRLAGHGFYLIGNAATVGAPVDLNLNLDNVMQNGAPDAVILRSGAGTLMDALCYEADEDFNLSTLEALQAVSEGGTGAVPSRSSTTVPNLSLSRLPNGQDTGNNLQDFALARPTPGAANVAAVSLPFFDSFDPEPNPAWLPGFVSVRSVNGGGSKPPTSPAGGRMLEVVDSSGGGDVAFLPGDFNRISLRCWLWLPPLASPGCSVGVGILTRNESAWFSSSTGFAIENGYYLEYQNGPLGSPLKAGALPNAPGQLRLIVADGNASLNTGSPSSSQIQVLAAAPAELVKPGEWNWVRLDYDAQQNFIAAYLGSSSVPFYEGPIPAGGQNRSGGVTVGFRENHSGSPTAGEAAWVDDLTISTNTSRAADAQDWSLYE